MGDKMNLDGLNEQQKIAVETTDGPILILAGAGSGKTRVLTSKIAYLISNCGIDPKSILAITFTNKAAKEMKDRVINILGPTAYDIQISTFHSFGLTILKENYSLLGYDKNFTILDSEDTLTIIKKILKDMNLDPKNYNPKAIRNSISNSKNELLDSSDFSKYANDVFNKVVLEVYKKYEYKLKTSNSLDFDDLLLLPIKLFESNKNILEIYQNRFNYILVDEYQDTNEAQYKLTKLISSKNNNICVVGDESQSIYSWRGANYKNILNFEKDHKNSKTILLEENYRSTKTILNAANNVIKNNVERKDKNLWTSNEEGDKIHYYQAYSEKDEARYICDNVKKMIENGVLKSEIAVLYRTNSQSRNIEESFLENGIPYRVIGSFYFYNRKEIKDLISYLKVIYNTKDDVNLLRIINVPKRGIGLKTIENLTIESENNNISLYESIKEGKELKFKELIEDFIKLKDELSLTELVDLVLEKSGIKSELENEKTLESEIRLENLNEFKSITKSYEQSKGIVSLEDFLNEISLVSDVEEYKDKKDSVTLMTIHSAKGLEFENVFIPGMEEGIFPHANSFLEHNGIEEERRLCYVAITRAKKNLYLINAKTRMLYGIENSNRPSRFIKEITDEYLNKENVIFESKDTKIVTPIVLDNNIEYNDGDRVIHDTFGEGIIISVSKSVLNIAFPHPYGIKTIMKGHSSIKKVK